MELTEIFFDTNFLRRKNIDDFSVFHFGNQVEDFIDFLGTNDVVDYYKINISEITTEELKKQINDKYKEELLKLNDCNMIACLDTGWRGIRNLRYFTKPEFIVIPKVECQLLL